MFLLHLWKHQTLGWFSYRGLSDFFMFCQSYNYLGSLLVCMCYCTLVQRLIMSLITWVSQIISKYINVMEVKLPALSWTQMLLVCNVSLNQALECPFCCIRVLVACKESPALSIFSSWCIFMKLQEWFLAKKKIKLVVIPLLRISTKNGWSFLLQILAVEIVNSVVAHSRN